MADLEKLLDHLRKFNSERDWGQFHSPKNLAMSLTIEAAELTEIFQWMKDEESRTLPPAKMEHLKEEIGDVMLYLLTLSDQFGINPIQAASEKMLKNAKKYPVELSRGRSDPPLER